MQLTVVEFSNTSLISFGFVKANPKVLDPKLLDKIQADLCSAAEMERCGIKARLSGFVIEWLDRTILLDISCLPP